MRRTVPLLTFTAVLALGLSACVPQPSPEPTEAASPTPAFTPSEKPTPTVSPTGDAAAPASDAVLIVSLDSASIAAGSTLEYSLNSVDAWTAALGTAPTQSAVEGPYGGTLELTALTWPGFTVTVPNDGSTRGATVRATTPTVSGHPVVTTGGIGVGSTRAEAVAAGATEGFDSTALRLDTRDVPGTQSLQRPGEVGREYVMLVLDGDAVTLLILPANDYSDI
ncbi:hypothetical protein SAMN04487788_3281 [Microbacterium testaceum StLB037]|uniref:Uncharacterized protein n=1 Tax=Microbacterium testaceum (strain StLB037) TaxID=979556 RepID=A0A1H0SA15_MICTS|nr:hypothetical protein [Microbacterium testaceum]SDP38058.1 hypothetical protein SAMN04487788_3281 [Microbacterium testaceum StLB037]